MPQSVVYLFRELNGEVPVEQYLETLQSRIPKAYAKCVDAILELERLGSEARRPLTDLLRDGIYELRRASAHFGENATTGFKGAAC